MAENENLNEDLFEKMQKIYKLMLELEELRVEMRKNEVPYAFSNQTFASLIDAMFFEVNKLLKQSGYFQRNLTPEEDGKEGAEQ